MAILDRYRRDARKPSYVRAIVYGGMLLVAVAAFFMARQRSAPMAAARQDGGRSYQPDAAAPPLAGWAALPAGKERALLGRVVDQRPLGVREHAEAYYYLLKKAHHVAEATLVDDVNPKVTYMDFARQADLIRGSVVRIRGLLLRLVKTPLQEPDRAGLRAVYEGQILGAENRVYSFVLTEPPAAPLVPGQVTTRDGLRVSLAGYFLQVITYENRETPPRRTATPLIIGRELALTRKSPPRGSLAWPWLAVGAAALAWLAWRICGSLFRR